jgi:hypothetical protein
MTRIAWVTHHLPVAASTGATFHLPGAMVGGAEMTDQAWRDAAPADVTIEIVPPGDWVELERRYDRIVVTGTDLLTGRQMMWLSRQDPVVFVHHAQALDPARKALIDKAALFMVHTPAHLDHELTWTTPKRTAYVLSPLEADQIAPAAKEPFALWAQRLHPLKGPLAARQWAAESGIPLVMLSDRPRAEVLEVMSRAEWFVHLPRELESESRATMEAVLSGCRVHANANVGITSVDGWDDPARLRDMLDGAADEFWRLVLS